jgi:hypothetical protein
VEPVVQAVQALQSVQVQVLAQVLVWVPEQAQVRVLELVPEPE